MLASSQSERKMEINIKRETENKLIGRSELDIKIVHPKEPTPKREDIRNKLAAQMNKDSNLIIIPEVKTSYGTGKSKCKVFIYKDEATLKATELPYMLKRHGAKDAPKEVAAPAE